VTSMREVMQQWPTAVETCKRKAAPDAALRAIGLPVWWWPSTAVPRQPAACPNTSSPMRWRLPAPAAVTAAATSPPGGPGSPGYMPSTLSTSLHSTKCNVRLCHCTCSQSNQAPNGAATARPTLGRTAVHPPEVEAHSTHCKGHLPRPRRLQALHWHCCQVGEGAAGLGAEVQRLQRRQAAAGI